MTRDALEAHYRRYIACLNARDFDALGDFVAKTLTYNGRPMTRRDYRDLIAGDVAAIPDLVFDIRWLMVDGDRVGCRLWFDCTPQRPFLGLVPDGRRVSFAENVFYRFQDRLIVEVWSLIDQPSIAAQLAAPRA